MPRYDLEIHRTAKRELDALAAEDRDRLTDTLSEVAATRQPTTHDSVRQLEGQDGLFRVRVGRVRAICTLSKPQVLILKVDYRDTVYDGIDEVHERLPAAG